MSSTPPTSDDAHLPPPPLGRDESVCAAADDAFAADIAAKNAAIARAAAWIVGLTMAVFIRVDAWVVGDSTSPLAAQALPWITASRVVAMAACAAFLVADSRGRSRWSTRALTAVTAAFFATLLGAVGSILGFYEWFQPSVGYYLAAVLFLSLGVQLSPRWALVVFAVGYCGLLVPYGLHPHARLDVSASTAIDMFLMSIAGLTVMRLGRLRAARMFVDARLIERQRDDLFATNQQLQRALGQAEESKEAAERAELAKSELLARISHEIRNPLHAMIALSETVSDRTVDPETKRLQRVVVDSAQLLHGIVDEVVEFSRADAGKVQVAHEPFSPRHVVSSIQTLYEPLATTRELALRTAVEGLPERLLGDEGRIRQVLINLVHNAVKFTDSGSVTVGARKVAEDAWQVYVADTGVGIPPERLEAVFSPFEQADSQVAARRGGAGLGLAISRQLARAMGGELWVESTSGAGSRFVLQLPLDPAPEVREMPDAAPAATTRALRLLVVEDDRVSQLVTAMMLRTQGHEVLVVDSGEEALRMVQEQRFDLMFLDLSMPGIGGREVVARVREAGVSTPIVVLSGSFDPQEREALLRDGAQDFIAKPCRAHQLAETLARWTGA